jgi:hypothetical protein
VEEDDAVGVFPLHGVKHQLFVQVGVVFAVRGRIGQVEGAAVRGQPVPAPHQQEGGVGTELACEAEQFVGAVEQLAFPVFAYK